jgi:hypothetical protein
MNQESVQKGYRYDSPKQDFYDEEIPDGSNMKLIAIA